jgi:hypothetical protein
MTLQTIVVMILALVVLGILLYLSYKYILQPGEAGSKTALSCRGECREQCAAGEQGVFGVGCPPQGAQPKDPRVYCCMKA